MKKNRKRIRHAARFIGDNLCIQWICIVYRITCTNILLFCFSHVLTFVDTRWNWWIRCRRWAICISHQKHSCSYMHGRYIPYKCPFNIILYCNGEPSHWFLFTLPVFILKYTNHYGEAWYCVMDQHNCICGWHGLCSHRIFKCPCMRVSGVPV